MPLSTSGGATGLLTRTVATALMPAPAAVMDAAPATTAVTTPVVGFTTETLASPVLQTTPAPPSTAPSPLLTVAVNRVVLSRSSITALGSTSNQYAAALTVILASAYPRRAAGTDLFPTGKVPDAAGFVRHHALLHRSAEREVRQSALLALADRISASDNGRCHSERRPEGPQSRNRRRPSRGAPVGTTAIPHLPTSWASGRFAAPLGITSFLPADRRSFASLRMTNAIRSLTCVTPG